MEDINPSPSYRFYYDWSLGQVANASVSRVKCVSGALSQVNQLLSG